MEILSSWFNKGLLFTEKISPGFSPITEKAYSPKFCHGIKDKKYSPRIWENVFATEVHCLKSLSADQRDRK